MSLSKVFTTFKDVITFPLFSINQTAISISSIIIFIFIVVAFIALSRFLKNKLLTKILSKFKLEEGLQFTLLRITQYITIFIGLVVAFQFVGIDLSGLAVMLGFLSVGIGFGLQNITSNFIAELILLFERPIKVGDRVTVGDTEGDVENITIRSTTIKTLNNISIIVPNSDFVTATVTNWSHGDTKIRVDLDVGVSYNSDLDEEEPFEIEASKYGLNYIKLDGNVGCMVNGAGLAMATMDIIKLAGGEPANFLDVCGGANKETVANGFKIILSDKNVKAILINIFGGIVRCDRVAQGVIDAVNEIKVEVPVVVRLEGTNAEEAQILLENSGLNFEVATSLQEAAIKVTSILN